MTVQLTIDQAGISSGVANVSRSDGLNTGAVVTLTSAAASSYTFTLLWVPDDDTTAVSSFAVVGNTATFTPDSASVGGTYRVKLSVTDGSGTSEITRLFSILTTNGLRIPALNEKADETASLANAGVAVIAASEFNEPSSGPFTSGNYGGWYKALADLIRYVDNIPVGVTLVPTAVVTTNYSAVVGQLIRANGTLTVTLPDSVVNGSQIGVVNYNTDTVTISATSINDGNTFALLQKWECVECTYSSADTRWIITSFYAGPGV